MVRRYLGDRFGEGQLGWHAVGVQNPIGGDRGAEIGDDDRPEVGMRLYFILLLGLRPDSIGSRRPLNGWRFWSVASDVEEEPAQAEKPASATPVATKLVKVIKRVPNQKGVAEGSMKWWCSACMKAFVAAGNSVPETCPEGHAREAADEFAEVSKDPASAE
jgi:hypothetical protein